MDFRQRHPERFVHAGESKPLKALAILLMFFGAPIGNDTLWTKRGHGLALTNPIANHRFFRSRVLPRRQGDAVLTDDLSSSAPNFRARIATLAWIDQLVVRRSLCPWASGAIHGPHFHLVVADDFAAMEDMAVQAARGLTMSASGAIPTTLVVLGNSSGSHLDAKEFGIVCARAQARILNSSCGVDLLGFHPERLDVGPGCSSDADDAAHFSVRSPLPTMQLLRREDLDSARNDWAAAHASDLPGALELLYENKQRLRTIGALELRRMLNSWRAAAGLHDA